MGYRAYLGAIGRPHYDQVKNVKTLQNVLRIMAVWGRSVSPEDDYLPVYDLVDREIVQVSETLLTMDGGLKQFFSDDDLTKEVTSDNDIFIIDKEGLKAAVETYRQTILRYYQQLKERNGAIAHFINTRIREWRAATGPLADLNQDREVISQSWLYEYGVFDLAYLYRTFDFDNELLVLYAY